MKLCIRDDRGSAAVEFAIVLPVLAAILLGVVEFSRVYDTQISLSNAAREAARTMVVTGDVSAAQAAAKNGSPALNPQLTNAQISGLAVCPTVPGSATTETVTITYTLQALTGFYFSTMNLTGRGAMLCNN